MTTLAVIPARYASSRFPGKPLVDINGKPMIYHVWHQASQARQIDRIIIATDDQRILEAAQAFGAEAVMTRGDHPSGTDRVWEVAENVRDARLILNIQGDEPLLNPQHLDAAVTLAQERPQADIVTLVCPLMLSRREDHGEYLNPNVVKAVMGPKGRIFYFSRAPIPACRDGIEAKSQSHRHLGMYLYRREALERFTQLPPSPLEQSEKLEQLRGLEAGMAFYGLSVSHAAPGIDTPEDLERLRRQLSSG